MIFQLSAGPGTAARFISSLRHCSAITGDGSFCAAGGRARRDTGICILYTCWHSPARILLFVHNPRLFFLSYPAIITLIAQGIKETCRQRGHTVRTGAALLVACILTSNVLTVLHLYIMRCLKIRDWDGLVQFFK